MANSDAENKVWMAYPVRDDGTLGTARVFYDVNDQDETGAADGLKVDVNGNLFATDDRLFWQASGDAAPGSPGSRGRSLMMLKITNDDPKPEKVAEGVSNV